MKLIEKLLVIIQEHINLSPNRVKYTMNNFIISVGTYIPALTNISLKVAGAISIAKVDMGGTECKLPNATEYISKIEKMGRIGQKRKTTFC